MLPRVVEVEADSLEKALDIVKANYKNEKIVVDYNIFVCYKVFDYTSCV